MRKKLMALLLCAVLVLTLLPMPAAYAAEGDPTTFVLSNEEGGLIDHLIAAGYGTNNMYELLANLQETSGGVITDEFLETLAACPAGSEIFTVPLSGFGGDNNPVCVNTDGTLSIQPIFGRDYYGDTGYSTYPPDISGAGREIFTYADNPAYYIDAGENVGGGRYHAFAIAWAQALTVAGTATDDTAILQIDNKTPSARDKTWEINVTSGTVKAGLNASDVTLTGLPAGLNYTAAKGTGNTIVITLTGAATTALTADATVTAVIKGSAVTEADAQDSAGISLKLWYVGAGTTFVISNESVGYLIDKLIAAGHEDDNPYEVLEALQPYSSGVITERFMKTLASNPADSEVFNDEAALSNFAGMNNPICVNADGTVSIQAIYGRNYHDDTGYTTTGSNLAGVGTVWITTPDSPAYYINAGVMEVEPEPEPITRYYKAFAILWMPTDTLTVAGTAADDTAILQIDNKTPSARDKTWELSVTSGTVKADLAASDVTLTGLPAGLTYTAAKGTGNTIVITLTGAATTALTADATVTAVIKGSAVTEADAEDSAGISLKLWYIGAGTTFVITNELGTAAQGGLIDKLIAAGHGTKNLYQVLELLKPNSGGTITDRFMKTLASAPADSEVFDDEAALSNFAGMNNPICVNADGTLSIQPIFGRTYHGHEGYTTTQNNHTGVGFENFTAANSAAYYIDAGSNGVIDGFTAYYKAFAIAWMPKEVNVPTFILSNESGTANEGGLIDKLIADGHSDDSLYDVLLILQPISGGAIPADFMAAIAAAPADCDAKTAELYNFSSPTNSPIGIGLDGNLIVAPIYGRTYYGDAGFSTTTGNIAGVGNVLFTSADSGDNFTDAGSDTYDGVVHNYEVFAIGWMDTAATPPTVTTISPTSGPEAGGTSVTITGTNFTGASAVKFGGSNAAYTVNSATQIVAVAPAGTGTVHVTVTTADDTSTTSSADRFTYTSGGGGGGGGGTTTTYNADVKEGGVKTDTLPVTVSGSTGTASLGAAKAAALFDAGNASVVMPSIPGVSAYTLELPASALDEGQKSGALTLSTGFGSVTLPDNMLESLAGTDGKTAGITVARGDASGLTDAEKAAVGSHPLIQLTLTLGGTKTEWNNPAAPVTVTIPYTPTAAELENPECIIIWYLDGSGNLVCVPNGHYDAATGTVTFKTTHFSFFAGGYKKVTFNDVAENTWYGTAVDFIAARGITTGTSGGNFSPDATLTRGQFIVMLMRSYGISPDAAPTDNFTDAGSTYYTNYLAVAKRLGIAKGVGNNLFAPEQPITRQEMFTLLYNALKVIGQLPQGNGRLLTDFTDADRIAPWAQEAMKRLVEAMMINGSGNKLSPEDTATRAELAQLLYNLLMQ